MINKFPFLAASALTLLLASCYITTAQCQRLSTADTVSSNGSAPSHHNDHNHSAAKQDNVHQLALAPNSAELLLRENKTITLSLDPSLAAYETSVDVKFNCEAGDGNTFSWDSPNPNCSILSLPDGYHYTLHGNDTKRDIVMLASADNPGKQQLVAHARVNNGSHTVIKQITIDTSKAYVTVNVGRSNSILIISAIVGWIYFAAWSISFYPQIWENFTRRSVVGLNFDYVALNITGFISYSAYNIAIKYIPKVEDEFFHKHPRSQNPIELNDVVFGLHAAFATVIVIVQCFIYERGEQTVSWFSKIFLAVVWAGYIVIGVMVQFTDVISLLDYIYIFSYVKLAITLIKYIPQGYYNYKRKSTVGWSIGNIFLDFTGGFLSMIQMFLLAYNYNDWVTIFNNFTKFGLGLISILFDVFFLLQHYVFYRHRVEHSSQSALLGDHSTATSPISNKNFAGDAFHTEKLDPSIPSLVNHISYGATDSINTNHIINISPSENGSSKSPSWSQNPHTVIH